MGKITSLEKDERKILLIEWNLRWTRINLHLCYGHNTTKIEEFMVC